MTSSLTFSSKILSGQNISYCSIEEPQNTQTKEYSLSGSEYSMALAVRCTFLYVKIVRSSFDVKCDDIYEKIDCEAVKALHGHGV